MITLPEKHHVLVVDDEPDVHAVTRLNLRGMRHGTRPVELFTAASGDAAVATMRDHPDTGVILLDVVMESSTAGLDACRRIREELGNRLVRILLRTGQPGAAPERKVIEEYDIDGYLPKAELTTTRLFTAVRTALRAFEELVSLERHRQALAFLHRSVAGLRAFEPLETALLRILETAVAIAPAPLAVLDLETVDEKGSPHHVRLHLAAGADAAAAPAAADAIATRLARDPAAPALRESGSFGDGYLVPLVLHRDLGNGWIYLERPQIDELARTVLPLLAAHAANALYATIAQSLLAAREGPFFDSVTV